MSERMRILDVMQLSFAKDKMSLEEELEKAINNNELPINEKEVLIKKLLKKIVLNDKMIEKWAQYIIPVEKNEE